MTKRNPDSWRTWKDPILKKKRSDIQKAKWADPEYRKKLTETLKAVFSSPEQRSRLSKQNTGKTHTEETKKQLSERYKGEGNPFFKRKHTEETKQKLRVPPKHLGGNNSICYGWKYYHGSIFKDLEKQPKLTKEEKQLRKLKERRTKYKPKLTKEEKQAISRASKLGEKNPNFGKKLSDKTIEKRTKSYIENLVGGFWYGNIKYYKHDIKEYCELWTPELCERIRAAWNYKSGVSGKTKEENRGKNLSCHHVYYQTKACCEWDEDTQGYYAFINIGTKKKPDIYKHYIKGSPNKFVPLTVGEHSATNHNKLFWILYFEDIILKKNGKCFFTKEEFNLL